MKKLAQLGLAAILAFGTAGAVLAEDAAATAAGAVKNSTSAAASTAVDATTTGSIGNAASLTSALDAGASADLSAITDASTVNFVTVSSFSDADKTSLDTAIGSKTEALASLRGSVSANAALKAKIEAAGYSSDDVLWVETGTDGAVTVYIDDRA